MRALMLREWRLAIGAGGGFGQGVGFFLIIIFLFGLGSGPEGELQSLAPAIIFIAVLLAGQLSLDRMFRADDEDGTLAQLRLAPLPLSSIILAKSFIHWLTSGAIMTLMAVPIAIALNVGGAQTLDLLLALLIGSPAFSLFGSMGAALTLSVRRASLIQAIITLPFYIPTLIYGTIAANPGPRQYSALLFLLALSLLALALAPLAAARIIGRHRG